MVLVVAIILIAGFEVVGVEVEGAGIVGVFLLVTVAVLLLVAVAVVLLTFSKFSKACISHISSSVILKSKCFN